VRLYQAIVILFVALAVLLSIQTFVQTVPVESIPEEFREVWNGIVYVFTTSFAAVLFTFLRNILGYAENWFEASPEEREKLRYEARLLGATWAKYEVYLKGYTAAIVALTAGTPYEKYAVYIAGAVGLITDFITKAIKDLAKSKKG